MLIFNLIVKDILIQKKTLLYSLIYAIFASAFFSSLGPNGFGLYMLSPMAITYMFITLAVSYDDKNKSDIIINSLPLKRSEIVISKYISIFPFAILGFVYSILIGFIGKAIGLPMFTRPISVFNIVFVLTSVCIFSSIFFPVYFKIGNLRMKFFNVILLMLIILLPSSAIDYATKNPNNIFFQKISYFISNTSSFTQYSLALIIGLIFFLISLMISIRIYNNKEF